MVDLTATRDSYDALAARHPDVVGAGLDDLPLERALLAAFAELILADGNRQVADVGCGSGRVTTVLARLGLDAFGVDLSPGMVALARRTYPDLRFEEGSLLALDLPDARLGGVLAFYSIIHTPWKLRAKVFAEFHRVLAPGGVLMLAFQVGSERSRRTELYGTPIELEWYRQQPDEISGLLHAAGFSTWSTTVREPGEGETTQRAYVIARKN
ncbi:class I SAM-dependent methyltransferase [Kribbella sp.]|uniref:class I SAM-dependent methyltransferase n=1 Tax=Kribbella sp. TaxID=1871183 RepID=UPI002D3051A6|nr:class I SAM-dependent methyltransferase [Kribbella sp.]HZX01717.1 class I SAM-dependent methyltransferase [Kribbella sp.]